MKYWITKTAKIAAIAYPTLKRVLLFMIELRAHTHGTPRRHIRLIQQSPWRDLDCGSLTMGTGRFGFNGGAACAANRAPGSSRVVALVRQQASETAETLCQPGRLVT